MFFRSDKGSFHQKSRQNRLTDQFSRYKRKLVFHLTYLIGKGMCQYIISNWGIPIWISFFSIIILLLIGLNTKHRTFTHSFLAIFLYSTAMYFFCRPASLPFLIGYASHIVADLFNKLGVQLFFPFKWRPCLKLCSSNKKANKVLFWICLVIDIVLGGYFFSRGLVGLDYNSDFISTITTERILGLNLLQLYLIFINIITFWGFQKDHKTFIKNLNDAYYKGVPYKDKDYETPMLRFTTWLLDFLVFIGGGVGMLLSLLVNLQFPAAYNGNWWAFCYTSIMFWFTIYCFLCNPFGFEIGTIKWLDERHIPLLIYLLGINIVSALFLFTIRKRRFKEIDIKHTFILIIGALGGTIGAIPMVFAIKRAGKYSYITMGFFLMLLSQIIFILYMMSVGAL